MNLYKSGDQFLFQDESTRDEACRILTHEHYVVRYFDEADSYGLYVIVREEPVSSDESPVERFVTRSSSDIRARRISEEEIIRLKNWPLVFDYDCPPLRFDEGEIPKPDFEQAIQDTKHPLDDIDHRIIGSS